MKIFETRAGNAFGRCNKKDVSLIDSFGEFKKMIRKGKERKRKEREKKKCKRENLKKISPKNRYCAKRKAIYLLRKNMSVLFNGVTVYKRAGISTFKKQYF